MAKITTLSRTPLYPVVSLFSGAMGLDLGLQAAGLHVAVAQEIDTWAASTIRENGHLVVEGDLRAELKKDASCQTLLKPAKLRAQDVFAVVGGPPCQTFSTAGRRKGTTDARGGLVYEFSRVVESIQPRFFVMENVKGMMSMRLDPADPSSPLFIDSVCRRFRKMGYHIVFGVLDAVHYGTAQFRERLVIIGSRDNEAIFLPAPTHFHMHQSEQYRWRTLRQCIGDLQSDPGPTAKFSPKIMEYLKRVPEGGNWKSLPANLVEAAMGGAYLSGGGKVGFYRRLSFDAPAPTLVTSPIQKATALCHPRELRPLSVKEYARIQGFPDNWKIHGSTTECYRQIGNAVPVPLAQAIGEMLRSVAEGASEVKSKRSRGTSTHNAMIALKNRLTNE